MIDVFNESYRARRKEQRRVKRFAQSLYLCGYTDGIKDGNDILDGIIKILSEGREKRNEL